MKRSIVLTLILTLVFVLSSILPAFAQDTLVIWADGERIGILEDIAADFEAEFGVTIELREIGLGDARDELLNFGPAGEGPDVLIQPHDTLGQLVANGAVVPIDLPAEILELYSEAALRLFTYQGQLWGLPYGIENVALVRNTDLVPEAPATWEEVTEISRELREAGEAEYGFLVQTGDAYHAFPILSGFGGYIFGLNDDGSFNISDIGLGSEGGVAAYQWMAEMYGEGLMVPNVDSDVVFSLFEEGELGMFITGPWFSQRITDSGMPYAISRLPGSEAMGIEFGAPFSGGQGFLVSAFSDNQADAFLFLEFISDLDIMEELYVGRLPVFEGVEAEDPNFEFFVDAGFNAVPMPAIPAMASVWGAAGDAQTLVSQGADPLPTVENAVAQILDSIEMAASGALNSVTLVGSLQSEAGCAGDWDPACETTFMTEADGVWSITVTLPAGDYEYKVAINGDWAENYGANAERDGANIVLSLTEETEVTFSYDRATNVITDTVNQG